MAISYRTVHEGKWMPCLASAPILPPASKPKIRRTAMVAVRSAKASLPATRERVPATHAITMGTKTIVQHADHHRLRSA